MRTISFFHHARIVRTCFLIAAIAIYCSDAPAQTSLSRWMSTLDDNKKLTELSIPGTHESCATKNVYNSQCQDMSLEEQLNKGIRFLDIRCRHFKNKFEIHHGPVYMDMDFGDVLRICKRFLAQNPTETILMSVKSEYDEAENTRSFAETFKDRYLKEYGDCFYEKSSVPALKEARGKIFLMKRHGQWTGGGGIQLDNWKDNNRDFTLGNYAWVQDLYGFSSCINSTKTTKLDAVQIGVNKAIFGDLDKFYINFASASGNVANDPRCFAEGINPDLLDYLKPLTVNRVGIIPMDFPSERLIKAIIDLNKFKSYAIPAGFSKYIGKRVRIKPDKREDPVCYWEVEDSGTKTGDLIQLWDTKDKQTIWQFEVVDPAKGTIRIKNVHSGKYVGSMKDSNNGEKCCLVSKSDKTSIFYVTEVDGLSSMTPLQQMAQPSYMFWSTTGERCPIECENGNLGNSTKIQFWSNTMKRTHWDIRLVD